ncbi:MAG: ribosome silencing factor [Planctomycetia bacterium]
MKEGTATATIDASIETPVQGLADARTRAIETARIAADLRGRDVLVLKLKGLVDWVDYMVVATGSSRRPIIAIADAMQEHLDAQGDRRLGVDGYDPGNWVVVDYGDVVLHVFDPEKRAYYQLEHLWADAEQIEWRRPGEPTAAATDAVDAVALTPPPSLPSRAAPRPIDVAEDEDDLAALEEDLDDAELLALLEEEEAAAAGSDEFDDEDLDDDDFDEEALAEGDDDSLEDDDFDDDDSDGPEDDGPDSDGPTDGKRYPRILS